MNITVENDGVNPFQLSSLRVTGIACCMHPRMHKSSERPLTTGSLAPGKTVTVPVTFRGDGDHYRVTVRSTHFPDTSEEFTTFTASR